MSPMCLPVEYKKRHFPGINSCQCCIEKVQHKQLDAYSLNIDITGVILQHIVCSPYGICEPKISIQVAVFRQGDACKYVYMQMLT